MQQRPPELREEVSRPRARARRFSRDLVMDGSAFSPEQPASSTTTPHTVWTPTAPAQQLPLGTLHSPRRHPAFPTVDSTPTPSASIVPTRPAHCSEDSIYDALHTPGPLGHSHTSSRRQSLVESTCTLPPLQAGSPSFSIPSLPMTPTSLSSSSRLTVPRQHNVTASAKSGEASLHVTPLGRPHMINTPPPPVSASPSNDLPVDSPPSISDQVQPNEPTSLRLGKAQTIVQRLYRSVLENKPEEPLHYIIEQLKGDTVTSTGRRPSKEHRDAQSTTQSTCQSDASSIPQAPPNMVYQEEASSKPHRIQTSGMLSEGVPVGTSSPSEARQAGQLAPPGRSASLCSEDSLTPTCVPSGALASFRNTPSGTLASTTNLQAQSLPQRGLPASHVHHNGITPAANVSVLLVRTAAPCVTSTTSPSVPPVQQRQQQFMSMGVYSSTGGGSLDETSRSEMSSMLSLNSVDLSEFLQEFRVAKLERLGEACQEVTIDQLSLILEGVTFPLPDMGIISDLFNELAGTGTPIPSISSHLGTSMVSTPQTPILLNPSDQRSKGFSVSPSDFVSLNRVNSSGYANPVSAQEVSTPAVGVATAMEQHPCKPFHLSPAAAGGNEETTNPGESCDFNGPGVDALEPRVRFETFLARMAFKIRGRYPTDVIHHAFFELVRRYHGGNVTQTSSAIDEDIYGTQQSWQESTPTTIVQRLATPARLEVSPRSVEETAVPSSGLSSVQLSPECLHALSAATPRGRLAATSAEHLSTGNLGQSVDSVTDTNFLATFHPPAHSPPPSNHTSVSPPAAFSSLVQTVPLRHCIVEGLQQFLGMRGFNGTDVQQALRMAQLPDSDLNYGCQVGDFARLAHTLANLVHGSESVATASPNVNSVLSSLKDSYILTTAM